MPTIAMAMKIALLIRLRRSAWSRRLALTRMLFKMREMIIAAMLMWLIKFINIDCSRPAGRVSKNVEAADGNGDFLYLFLRSSLARLLEKWRNISRMCQKKVDTFNAPYKYDITFKTLQIVYTKCRIDKPRYDNFLKISPKTVLELKRLFQALVSHNYGTSGNRMNKLQPLLHFGLQKRDFLILLSVLSFFSFSE